MAFWKNLAAAGVATGLTAAALWLVRRYEAKQQEGLSVEFAETMGEFPDLPDEELDPGEIDRLYQVAAQEEQRALHAGETPDGGPNQNPVEAPPAPAQNGAWLDPTKIASAEDFQDWDDVGCNG